MSRTIVSPSDTLAFVTGRNDECWAIYKGYRFRITGGEAGRDSWRVWFIDPDGNRIMWHTVYGWGEPASDERPFTKSIKGRNQRTVIRKAMKYIDQQTNRKEPGEGQKWPNC